MYYVVEYRYEGDPEADLGEPDADHLYITTSKPDMQFVDMPAYISSPMWGPLKKMRVIEHGEYPSIETARDAISDRFGPVRGADREGKPFFCENVAPPLSEPEWRKLEGVSDDVIEEYRFGEREPLGWEGTKLESDANRLPADPSSRSAVARFALR